jgi:DNA replication protein DnaC
MKSIGDVLQGMDGENHQSMATQAEDSRPDSTGTGAPAEETTCKGCGGLGWLRRELPVEHPEFGKLIRCPDCNQASGYPRERYGLAPQEIRELSWGNLIETDSSLIEARQTVRRALQRGYGWVYMWSFGEEGNPGGNGLAKTLILKIAVAECLRNGKEAAYVNMAGLLDDLRAAYDTHNPSLEAVRRLELWATLPVLALDEFNRVNETEYAIERRFMLMDTRYTRAIRREGVTLIASNTNPAVQEAYLYDRIRDGRFSIVRLRGESFRPYADWTQNY